MATWAEYFASKGIDVNSEMTEKVSHETESEVKNDNKDISNSDAVHNEVKGTDSENSILSSFNDKFNETMNVMQEAFKDLALGGDNTVVKEKTAEEVIDSFMTNIKGGNNGNNANL